MSSNSGSTFVPTVAPPRRSLTVIFVVPIPAPRNPMNVNFQLVRKA